MATAIAMTIITAILCLPLINQIVKVRRPIRISEDATRLKIGLFRGFTLHHLTGTVVDANSHDVITTSTWVDLRTGMQVGSVRTTTTQHENIYIRQPNGEIKQVHIINYDFRPPVGHVVSIWNAHRGDKYFTIAAINHTTRSEYVNDVQLYEVMKPGWSQILFVLYICFLVLPVSVLAVFGGMGLPLALYFVLLFLYVMGLRKTQKKFKGRGLKPIRTVSHREANLEVVTG